MTKELTVAALSAYLKTIPNQNLPVTVVASADLKSAIFGDISYIEECGNEIQLHVHGSFTDFDDEEKEKGGSDEQV